MTPDPEHFHTTPCYHAAPAPAAAPSEDVGLIAGLISRLNAAGSVRFPATLCHEAAAAITAAHRRIAELERDKLARSKIDPITRMHNLCDAIAEHRRESPFTADALDLQDEAYREKCRQLKEAEAALAAARRVPREPTMQMEQAGSAVIQHYAEDDVPPTAIQIWRAMFDAAQPIDATTTGSSPRPEVR